VNAWKGIGIGTGRHPRPRGKKYISKLPVPFLYYELCNVLFQSTACLLVNIAVY